MAHKFQNYGLKMGAHKSKMAPTNPKWRLQIQNGAEQYLPWYFPRVCANPLFAAHKLTFTNTKT